MNKEMGITVKFIIAITIIITIILIFQYNNDDNIQSEQSVVLSNNDNTQVKQNMVLHNENSIKVNENIKSTHIYEKDGNGDENTLTAIEKINLCDLDGNGKNYTFICKGTSYKATYSKDNWHIVDSYRITDRNDIATVCQALIEVHPIHGRDMSSYRTIEDMVYEWTQHNIAYYILPEDNKWKKNAKDVDLDPADQGRSLAEMYEARTGKKFNIMMNTK